MIPIGQPSITPEDLDSVARVLKSGDLVQGGEVEALESELAEFVGVRHAVVVSSGTAALLASLLSLRLEPGDVVLVGAYSWIATANTIELAGGTPVFVDIDPDSFAMDPRRLEEALDRLRDTNRIHRAKAVLVIDVFGRVADLTEILRVSHAAGIPVIEDAACALGAGIDGMAAGSWGAAGCFSFHPLKTMTTGEGGAVSTDSDEIANFSKAYRNHGQVFSEGRRSFEMAGANLRMTDFQAALGRSQLARLPALLEERRDLTERYIAQLSDLPLRFQTYDRPATTGQSFVIVLEDAARRAATVAHLRSRHIEAGTGTIAMPFTSHFGRRFGLTPQDLPITAAIARSVISLPIFNDMSLELQDEVIAALREALGPRGGRR